MVSKLRLSTQSNQAGFTIVESLVAIVVVSILMAAISPVITLSVATRVQARRIELASQAAKAYIDGINSGAIAPPTITVARETNQYFLDSAPVPSALADLYCVNLDNIPGCSSNSAQDLAIQGFRSQFSADADDAQKGYRLGLRVYRADAFSDRGALNKGSKQATFTGGLGNLKTPLVEMTTEIATQDTQLPDLCDRFGGCQ
ncbi:transposase [Aliterella atlantica CENA595]|uniref:Transposase n=1 Tax=Aliterella atlantica CENA595 TaxID=1618023 RepID=A0A0D8ZVE3_9CYAN|nr:transposase [Aliterella atlantica CENA595]